MSKLIIDFTPIVEINVHPNADKLELAKIKGWQVCVGKGTFQVGDNVIFIPPDAILSAEMHEALGITNYLAGLPKHYGKSTDKDVWSDALETLYGDAMNAALERPTARRVKAARLRGQASYGVVIQPHIATQLAGFTEAGFDGWHGREDIAADLGIIKWEPPFKETQADVERDIPTFHKYTDIENIKNYPDVIQAGEKVYFTEKIHGTNCRLGYVREPAAVELSFTAGSHNTRRKEGGLYWKPFEWCPKLKEMLEYVSKKKGGANVVIFGEIYGAGVQDMAYGHNGTKGFRAFDIAVDGTYMGYLELDSTLVKFEIPMVPKLWTGPFSMEKVEELTDGKSVCDDGGPIREGVVVCPLRERDDPNIGRVILKSISVDYLSRKGGTDGH